MADEALIAWVQRAVGSGHVTLDEQPTRHGQTRVARVLDAHGHVIAWWKRAATTDAARREADALRRVSAVAVGSVPALLDHDPLRGWLLLGHVDGVPWVHDPRAMPADAGERLRRATALGRWRGVLDVILVDDDPLPLDAAIDLRRRRWIERASGVVDDRMIEILAAHVDAGRFTGESRGLCHRDLDPDNVIWVCDAGASDERPVVLDFGQARADHPLVDAVRLRITAFADDDAGFDAFLGSWRGRGLVEDERARLESLLALEILATAAWAGRHGDLVFRDRASRAFRRFFPA